MIVIKGICYIIGASKNENGFCFSKNDSDYVIAADGGYDFLLKNKIYPDVLIGDFDSVNSKIKHKNVIKHPIEKDDTDSFLAYKYGLDKGYHKFVIYGGMGGRFDHTVANIQMLCNMAKHGARGFLLDDNTVVTAICNSKIRFSCENSGKFGVFAQGKDANGVSLKGVKYTLDNAVITTDFPVGVSNEFIGSEAEISVTDGVLLIIWYESEKDFLDKINLYTEELS